MKNKPNLWGRPGGRPPLKGPPPPAICCDYGYIIEKIVHRQSESLCFEGILPLNGLPNGFCPPLTLCNVEVLQIRPCRNGMMSCGCGKERLEISLLCVITDAYGCQTECCSTIEVESCVNSPCAQQGLNMRRAAEVCVGFNRFCPPCGLEVSLRIQLQTLFSRCEMVSSKPACSISCPSPLPLYPPPIRRFH